jgi:hypothetical protein
MPHLIMFLVIVAAIALVLTGCAIANRPAR